MLTLLLTLTATATPAALPVVRDTQTLNDHLRHPEVTLAGVLDVRTTPMWGGTLPVLVLGDGTLVPVNPIDFPTPLAPPGTAVTLGGTLVRSTAAATALYTSPSAEIGGPVVMTPLLLDDVHVVPAGPAISDLLGLNRLLRARTGDVRGTLQPTAHSHDLVLDTGEKLLVRYVVEAAPTFRALSGKRVRLVGRIVTGDRETWGSGLAVETRDVRPVP